MVLLKDILESHIFDIEKNLHSTMVLLKALEVKLHDLENNNLHSTMVLLKV